MPFLSEKILKYHVEKIRHRRINRCSAVAAAVGCGLLDHFDIKNFEFQPAYAGRFASFGLRPKFSGCFAYHGSRVTGYGLISGFNLLKFARIMSTDSNGFFGLILGKTFVGLIILPSRRNITFPSVYSIKSIPRTRA